MLADRARCWRAALVLLVAAQVGGGWWWAAHDEFPAGYEVCEHLIFARSIAREYGEALASDEPGALWRWAVANRRIWTRATLVHLALAPAAHAWNGDDARLLAGLTGAASLILLAMATYAMTHRLASAADPEGASVTAVLAATLVVLAPGCWGTARRFGVDLPLAAAVATHAALLVCRPPWRSLWATAAHGLLAGALCLVKAQFLFWSPGLVLPSLLSSGLSARAACGRLAVFAAMAAVGSSPFWAGDLVEIMGVFGWHATALDNPSNDLPEQWTARAFAYYPTAVGVHIGLAALPLVALGLARARGRIGSDGQTLALGLASAYVVHTAITLKFARYALPAVPLLAALAAVGLRGVADAWRRGLVIAAVVGGISIEMLSSWGALGLRLGVDPEVCHPPVASTWFGEVRGVAHAAGAAPDEGALLVGIEGPEGWDPDDFSRLEWMLQDHYPLAEFVRRSPLRSAYDLAHFEERLPELWMRVVVTDPESEAEPELPSGWRSVYAGALTPAVRPIPGVTPGSPLRVAAWVCSER